MRADHAAYPSTGDAGRALHADALEVLSSWEPPSPRQATLREEYVALLHARTDATSRSCVPDHLTAGTLVVSPAGDQVLLNLHRKAGRWFAFGGHAEPADPTLGAAARREAVEESGLPDLQVTGEPVHLDVHEVAFCDPRGTVRHLDVRYAAVADPADRPAASAESLDVRWWPVDGLPELEDEMHELIRLARRRLC